MWGQSPAPTGSPSLRSSGIPSRPGSCSSSSGAMSWSEPLKLCWICIATPIKIFYRNWFQPLGSFLGIKCSVHRKPPTNEVLEAEFNKMAKDKLHVLNYQSLSKQIDMSERQIQVWLRNRKVYGLMIVRLGIKVQESNVFQGSLQSWRSFARLAGGACSTPGSPCTGSGACGTSPGHGTSSSAGNPPLASLTHFHTSVPKALIVTSFAVTSHVTRDHWGPWHDNVSWHLPVPGPSK